MEEFVEYFRGLFGIGDDAYEESEVSE